MSTCETPEPLRNIPIQIVIDGIEITGEILWARFNDIWVVIHAPVSGFGTGLHVPWFRIPAIRACHSIGSHRSRGA